MSDGLTAVLLGNRERGGREGEEGGAGMFGAGEAFVGGEEGGGGWEVEGGGASAIALAVDRAGA